MEAERRGLGEMMAEALEIEETPELLAHLPFLLADLPTLGGPVADVLDLLREGGLAPGARVLDLGCGRGEIALAVAREFDARVVGVDGHEGFLRVGRERAGAEGLAHRVEWIEGDLRDVGAEEPFDAALLLSVGPVMGDYGKTMGWLGGLVRPGGLIVIEDCHLAAEAKHPQYGAREAMEAAMTTHGDRIVARREDTEEMVDFNRPHTMEAIARRGEELARRHPELAPAIEAYLSRQRREFDFLTSGGVVLAIWLLRR